MKHSYCWTGEMPCTGVYRCTHCKLIADATPLDYSRVDRGECPNLPISLTHAQIEELSKENHYVRNLICLKQIWGLNARVGIVLPCGKTAYAYTIADLVKIDCCDSRFLIIDSHIGNLRDIHDVPLKQHNR